MAAISSGIGTATLPSQVNASSSALIVSKVSISTTRRKLERDSGESLWRSFLEIKIALLSEWIKIFVTSFSEDSVRIGTTMRLNGTQAKNATVQLGVLLARIATLSHDPIPY